MFSNILKLITKIGVDSTEFDIGLKRVESSAKGFGDRVSKQWSQDLSRRLTGAFAVGGLMYMTSKVRELAGEGGALKDLSDRFGISTDTLQDWQYAAKMTGSSIEDLIAAYKKFSQARQDALNTGKIDKFAFLNIGLGDLKGGNLEAFTKAIKAIGQLSEAEEYAAEMMDLFGKNAMAIIPIAKDGIEKFKAELAGSKLTAKDIVDLDKIDDEFTKLANKISYHLKKAIVGFSKPSEWIDWGQEELEKKYNMPNLTDEFDANVKEMRSNRKSRESASSSGFDWATYFLGENPDLGQQKRGSHMKSLFGNSYEKMGLYSGGAPVTDYVNVSRQQLMKLVQIEKNTRNLSDE